MVTTNLHGEHLRRLSIAVNCTVADQFLFGDASKSYKASSRRKSPLFASASSINWLRGESFEAARQKGRDKRVASRGSLMAAR
jgi:hypothetical protein